MGAYLKSESDTRYFRGLGYINQADADFNTFLQNGCYQVYLSSWGNTLNSPSEQFPEIRGYGIFKVSHSNESTIQNYCDSAGFSVYRIKYNENTGWTTWKKTGSSLTASDVNALPITGGTLTGDVKSYDGNSFIVESDF